MGACLAGHQGHSGPDCFIPVAVAHSNCAGRKLSPGWVQSAPGHQGSQIGSMKSFAIHNYFHNTCWINLKINIPKCEESLTTENSD